MVVWPLFGCVACNVLFVVSCLLTLCHCLLFVALCFVRCLLFVGCWLLVADC